MSPENTGAVAEQGAPALTEAQFALTGMHCAACATVIEKVVGKQRGVDSVAVNLAAERMTVSFEALEIDAAAIVRAVEGAGYGATELREHAPAPVTAGHVELAVGG
ncbi:MAG: heavy-metal-associated domain-containing protein, partial [Actinobacteria bacterium]